MSFQNALKKLTSTRFLPSEQQPSQMRSLHTKLKDHLFIDRTTEHFFRKLGWNDPITSARQKIDDKFNSLLARSTAVSSIIDTYNNFLPVYNIISKGVVTEEVRRKTLEQFNGYFVDNLEKRIGVELPKTLRQQYQIQHKAKNLEEDLNPLRLERSEAFGALLSFIEDVIGSGSTSEQRAKLEAEKNEAFYFTWDMFETLLTAVKDHMVELDSVRAMGNANNLLYINELTQGIEGIISIAMSSSVNEGFSNTKSVFEQLTIIKSNLLALVDIYRKAVIREQGVDVLAPFVEVLRTQANEISATISRKKRILMSIEIDVRQLSPAKVYRDQVEELGFSTNEYFFIDDDQFELAFSKFYRHARNSYKINGRSSVNAEATSFINKGPSRRDVLTEIDRSFSRFEPATPFVGIGDAMAHSTEINALELDGVGPIKGANYTALLEAVAEGRAYNYQSDNGFIGRYAFSPMDLAKHGVVKTGTTGKGLNNDSAWIDPASADAFKGNQAKQDEIVGRLLSATYKALLGSGVLNTRDPVDEVGAAIATAYKFGAGTLKDLEFGDDAPNGSGDSAVDFFNSVKGNFDPSLIESDPNAIAAIQSGGSEIDAVAAVAVSNVMPDTMPVHIPIGGQAPLYPHNLVTESESGHFREVDDTPGMERINERHRSGTGYEILSDGTRKVVVSGDSYRATMGSDYIMVEGNVNIICHGDVGIKADGDVNIQSGNDINLNAGGTVRINSDGDMVTNVAGSRVDAVYGDYGLTVAGFGVLGFDGDLQLEAASICALARAGSFDIKAAGALSIAAQAASILSNSGLQIAAANTLSVAASEFEVEADSIDMEANSLDLAGNSGSFWTSGTLQAAVRWAQEAGSIGSRPTLNSQADVSGAAGEAMDGATDSQFVDNIKTFVAVDTSTTQANGRGGDIPYRGKP